MLLAPHGVHDRGLQTFSKSEELPMGALAPGAAQHRHASVAIQKRRQSLEINIRGGRNGLCRKQTSGLWYRRIQCRLKRYIAWDDHNRDAAL